MSDALDAGRDEDARRARHALTGLCSAFGAMRLQQACATGADRATLAMIAAATVADMRALAFPATD